MFTSHDCRITMSKCIARSTQARPPSPSRCRSPPLVRGGAGTPRSRPAARESSAPSHDPPGPPILGTGNTGGLPGDPVIWLKAANTDRRAHRRQEATLRSRPRARLLYGLASQSQPASRAARAHSPSPPAPAPPGQRSPRQPAPARWARHRAAATPASRQPAARAKFSGQRDRPGEEGFYQD